jgi:16S rRNA (guanine(1405)-N(7))-methyltransferase
MTQPYEQIINRIQGSKKYRDIGIPEETLIDIINREAKYYPDYKSLEEVVRRKLHNIVAPYLENIDYAQELHDIETAFDPSDESGIQSYCSYIMSQHASSKERLPHLAAFYQIIFSYIGVPGSILDLACGLNPFAIPFMSLPKTTHYHAYDIHKPRIDLINRFFSLYGMQARAHHQDILVNPPEEKAEAAFFFKEAHRLEKRAPGSNRILWQALDVNFLIISLPITDLKHHHDLTMKHRKLVTETVAELNWRVTDFVIQDEIIFMIEK